MDVSPILNRPWDPPSRHWQLDSDFRQTGQVVDGRRPSGADQPVPLPKKGLVYQLAPLGLDARDRVPHKMVNEIREAVRDWSDAGGPGLCHDSKRLLDHWSNDRGDVRPFFCQVEAAATVMWLHEARRNLRDEAVDTAWCELEDAAKEWSDSIVRTAIKMATGTGKTRVMAMLIAWWAGWRRDLGDGVANVLAVAPNLTIKRNLRSLSPESDAGRELYKQICPPDRPIAPVRVSVENYQQFQTRGPQVGGTALNPTHKALLFGAGGPPEELSETIDTMLTRKLPDHRRSSEILVLNDEAHHCYKPFDASGPTDLEAKEWESEAALWFNLLRGLRDSAEFKLGPVIDLSATPMFLRRPPNMDDPKLGEPVPPTLYTDLFPWVVSDTPLVEAVECGLTKIPRLPVDDDADHAEVAYRNTYKAVDKKDRRLVPRKLPGIAERLLKSLVQEFEDETQRRAQQFAGRDFAPPVFILIANTIANAEALYRHIAGERTKSGWQPGAFPSLSNVEEDASGPKQHPTTLLVHSQLSERTRGVGAKQETLSRAAKAQLDFIPKGKRTAAQHKAHLQEMFDQAAQPGTPGEHVRCIVSVAMLTEGWDVRSVTHIFGFRPFQSQLLCEQAAGRALRRTVHADPQDKTMPGPEYASIFGIPFEFMRARGEGNGTPPPEVWRVYALRGRKALRLKLPQLDGYALQETADRFRFEIGAIKLGNPNAPMLTLIAGPVGQDEWIETPGAERRWQEFLYEIAQECVKLFVLRRRSGDGLALRKMSLFASLRVSLSLWTSAMQELHGDNDWRVRAMHLGAGRIADTLAEAGELSKGHVRIVPTFHEGSQGFVDTKGTNFLTTLSIRYPQSLLQKSAGSPDPPYRRSKTLDMTEIRPPMDGATASPCQDPIDGQSRPPTPELAHLRQAPECCNSKKSELNAAACHSMLEERTAALLDQLECVDAWARNFRLGWTVPYMAANGAWRRYEPDFAVRLKQSDGGCPLYLMVECKGVMDDDAIRKERYVRDWWIPAVNDSPEIEGQWSYCMVTDIRKARADIQGAALELRRRSEES